MSNVEHVREQSAYLLRSVLCGCHASPALAEGLHRLRQARNYLSCLDGLPENTCIAARLLLELSQVALVSSRAALSNSASNDGSPISNHPRRSLRIGCINPHRNGLMNISGSSVVWRRLKDPEVGLLRTLDDFGFSLLGLSACRVFGDFQLPESLGARLDALGGVSYHSVGVLRPLEVCLASEVFFEHSTSTALLVRLGSMLVVFFALPVYSGAGSDAHWVASLTKASATSAPEAAAPNGDQQRD